MANGVKAVYGDIKKVIKKHHELGLHCAVGYQLLLLKKGKFMMPFRSCISPTNLILLSRKTDCQS